MRHSLKEFGIKEIAVADYMAVVCADFGCSPTKGPGDINHRVDSLYSVDYLEAIQQAGGHHKFFLHVQCANQFLVLTCLYPDFIHRRAERRGAPDVDYYEHVVVSHLEAASRHALADEFGEPICVIGIRKEGVAHAVGGGLEDSGRHLLQLRLGRLILANTDGLISLHRGWDLEQKRRDTNG